MTTSRHNCSCSRLLESRSAPWSECTAASRASCARNNRKHSRTYRYQSFHVTGGNHTLESRRLFSIEPSHVTFVVFSPGSSLIKTTDMVRRSSPVSPAASTYGLIHSGQYCYKVLGFNPIRATQAHSQIPGHERSLTQIKFNKEGDLLFSCSKDHVINVWFSHNGERLGTYDGHNGTVWTIDVDCTSLPVFNLSSMNTINRPHQRNPGFSCLDRPITPSDCGPSSQANACTSGNFPRPSKA